MKTVEINQISKKFEKKTVLDNISFEIEKGEIMGLIGPNGAGKTTLINIMLGLLLPDYGEVKFAGQNLKENEMAIKQKIGYIPQELALIEESTCWHNLLYFATLYNIFGKERQIACEKALKLANLEEEKDKKVSKLSGGMKRRLNIACGTMHKPEFLILDEPTVGVDPQSRNYIFEHLLELNREEGITILYTSHYMEEVEKLCDRIFIIDEGKKVAFGEKESIRGLVEAGRQLEMSLQKPLSPEGLEKLNNLSGVEKVEESNNQLLMTIRPEEFSLTKAIHVAEEEGIELNSITNHKISLEEVFLELTGKELRQ